jgi:hypothetical protein
MFSWFPAGSLDKFLDSSLIRPFQSIIPLSSYHSMLCSFNTVSIIKYPTENTMSVHEPTNFNPEDGSRMFLQNVITYN